MNRHSRKSLVKLAELDIPRLAKRLGVSRVAVYNVINGKSRSKRIEDQIASALRIPATSLFPAAHHRKARFPGRSYRHLAESA